MASATTNLWLLSQPKLVLIVVEFYLYPTVSTALVHSVKPKLTEYDEIEFGERSN